MPSRLSSFGRTWTSLATSSATLLAVSEFVVGANISLISYAEEILVYANKEQEKDREKFIDKSTGTEMEQDEEPQALLEWFAEKYKDFGANLEFVTNRSQEGAQFVKGFGGIGGLLRYKVDLTHLTSVDDDEEDEFMSDDDVL